jgi:hypothetical protein
MNQKMLIALVLTIVGFLLIFCIDILKNKFGNIQFMDIIYKNNKVIGVGCLLSAYYLYTQPVLPEIPAYTESSSL